MRFKSDAQRRAMFAQLNCAGNHSDNYVRFSRMCGLGDNSVRANMFASEAKYPLNKKIEDDLYRIWDRYNLPRDHGLEVKDIYSTGLTYSENKKMVEDYVKSSLGHMTEHDMVEKSKEYALHNPEYGRLIRNNKKACGDACRVITDDEIAEMIAKAKGPEYGEHAVVGAGSSGRSLVILEKPIKKDYVVIVEDNIPIEAQYNAEVIEI